MPIQQGQATQNTFVPGLSPFEAIARAWDGESEQTKDAYWKRANSGEWIAGLGSSESKPTAQARGKVKTQKTRKA